MAQIATVANPDDRRSGDRSLTDRWYIEATRQDANTVEAVDLIASHNARRKTIDIDLRRIAVDGASERFKVCLLAREANTTSVQIHRIPCSRYSAKRLREAMWIGRAHLDELLFVEDAAVAELFRDAPHY